MRPMYVYTVHLVHWFSNCSGQRTAGGLRSIAAISGGPRQRPEHVHKHCMFFPRDAMRKRGLCYRPVSVRLSVTLVYCIQMAEDIG